MCTSLAKNELWQIEAIPNAAKCLLIEIGRNEQYIPIPLSTFQAIFVGNANNPDDKMQLSDFLVSHGLNIEERDYDLLAGLVTEAQRKLSAIENTH